MDRESKDSAAKWYKVLVQAQKMATRQEAIDSSLRNPKLTDQTPTGKQIIQILMDQETDMWGHAS